jgi:hypothetical protein
MDEHPLIAEHGLMADRQTAALVTKRQGAALFAAADVQSQIHHPAGPMWLSMLWATGSELVTDGLVYRYDPGASPDGLQG